MAYGNATLLDLSKMSSDVPVNVIHTIVDAMPLFDQMAFQPCNDGTSNKTMVITDYPKGQTRAYNEGVRPEKAGGMVVTDSTCMVQSYSQIDADMLEMHGNSAEWRANQEAAFPIGMAHEMAYKVFNGSLAKDPKSFNGLAVRYNHLGGDFKDNVLDAGGQNTAAQGLADIWICDWGQTRVHGIHPAGAGVAGFTRKDKGQVECFDANGLRYDGVVTQFKWNMGIAVEDRRSVIRIANVDIAQCLADGSGTDLVDLLIDAVEMLPANAGSGCAIYMNKALRVALRKQIGHRENVNLQWETVAGRKVVTYDGIPVHKLPTSILPTYNKRIA